MSTLAISDGGLALQAPRRIAPGQRLCDLVPRETPGAMLSVNGAWILRDQWDYPIREGDRIEAHFLPAGNDGRKALRTLLQITATYFLGPAGLALEGTALAIATVASTAAINALVPNQQPSIAGFAEAGSPTYDTNLSGNRAALNQPIPVGYGRVRTFPPFAAEPYQEYDENDDQYYHALLCVGMGNYTIESLSLDDTDLDHYADVQYAVLEPGEAPSLVLANVVTAPEVSGQELNAGRSSPAIAACRGGLQATHVAFDIVFDGLGNASGSTVTDVSVQLRFDWRPIDNWGVPTATWSTLATETITAASTENVRRSYKYSLPTTARPEVRVVRITPRDDDPLILNDARWAGLRAYLDQTATLAADATHIEIKMRATEQLNGLTQRRVAVIWRRLLNTWNPDDGWSASQTFTRNPAWCLADKLRNDVYGNALPDSRIDLDTLYSLAQTWDERQDRLDIVFDSAMDSDEADQAMARAGRARAIWRNGVRTFVRDEAQTIPAAVFTGRDIAPGSVSLSYSTDVAKIPDGIIVEYFSHQSWDWESVTCPAPGVVTPTRPEYMRLLGVTGTKHAEREGLYEAAARSKRRKFTSYTTELQGMIPAYGSMIVHSLPLRGYGVHGDIVSYDPTTREAVLSEPTTWGGARYLTLQRPDGTVSESIECTEGADAYTVTLSTEPDFDLLTNDGRRERTRYVFGSLTEHRRTALVLGIRPQDMTEDGVAMVQIATVNDDDAIHAADADLLPVGDEVQDSIDSPNTEGPGGDVYVAYLSPRTVSNDAPAGGNTAGVTIRMRTDGQLQVITVYGGSTTTIAGQWIIGAPYDISVASTFEVRATLISGSLNSGTTGAWLAMSSQRDWSVGAGPSDGESATAVFDLEIRDTGGLSQALARMTISASTAEFGG